MIPGFVYTPSEAKGYTNCPVNLANIDFLLKENDHRFWFVKFHRNDSHLIVRWAFDTEEERDQHWQNLLRLMECV